LNLNLDLKIVDDNKLKVEPKLERNLHKSDEDDFLVITSEEKNLKSNKNGDFKKENKNEEEWILLEQFDDPYEKKIKGNPFQRLSRKFICGAEDCENITLLISLECSQCHKKYCLQHADLLKEIESTNPSDKTYLCIDCKEKKYQSIGPIRSHTEEFKSARTLAIDNFKTSGA